VHARRKEQLRPTAVRPPTAALGKRFALSQTSADERRQR
jgi:hypothetical protein